MKIKKVLDDQATTFKYIAIGDGYTWGLKTDVYLKVNYSDGFDITNNIFVKDHKSVLGDTKLTTCKLSVEYTEV